MVSVTLLFDAQVPLAVRVSLEGVTELPPSLGGCWCVVHSLQICVSSSFFFFYMC